MIFSDWENLLKVLVVGVSAYAALMVVLRVAGERTLSKMNAFDLIVTVALGSVLGTVIVSRDVPLAEGVLALALLVGLQYLITWLSVREKAVRRAVKGTPKLLLMNGEMLQTAMKEARVTESEILAAVRSEGVGKLSSVAAVVLETNGKLSVVSYAGDGKIDALSDVEGYGRAQ